MIEIQHDQYYTHPDEVDRCIELFQKYYAWSDFDVCLDPCAGTGAFYNRMPEHTRVGWDIDPKIPGITQQDFYLSWIDTDPVSTLIMTNPPYGRRGKDAIGFFNRGALWANTQAYIFPRGMRKPSQVKRLHEYFHLIDEIPIDRFCLADGTDYEVKSIFQIWQRLPQKREHIVLPTEHPDLELTHAHMSRISSERKAELLTYDLAVGQVSGRIKPPQEVHKGSWWFVKFAESHQADIFKQIDFCALPDTNTQNMSLTKAEIIDCYHKQKIL